MAEIADLTAHSDVASNYASIAKDYVEKWIAFSVVNTTILYHPHPDQKIQPSPFPTQPSITDLRTPCPSSITSTPILSSLSTSSRRISIPCNQTSTRTLQIPTEYPSTRETDGRNPIGIFDVRLLRRRIRGSRLLDKLLGL